MSAPLKWSVVFVVVAPMLSLAGVQVTFGLMMGSAVCFTVLTWLKPYHDRKHGCGS